MMKRIMSFVLLAVMMFSLVACPAPNKKIELKEGLYFNEDATVGIELCGDYYRLHIMNMSYHPSIEDLHYRIEKGVLILNYPDNYELLFEIDKDKLIFLVMNKVDENNNKTFYTDKTCFTNQILRYTVKTNNELKEGLYFNEDATVGIELCGDYYLLHIMTMSYHPSIEDLHYRIEKGVLILSYPGTVEFHFKIDNDKLIFIAEYEDNNDVTDPEDGFYGAQILRYTVKPNIELKQGLYLNEDATVGIELCDGYYLLHGSNVNCHPSEDLHYRIVDGLLSSMLILSYTENLEFHFSIENDMIILISAQEVDERAGTILHYLDEPFMDKYTFFKSSFKYVEE